jgi:hypothetical protein
LRLSGQEELILETQIFPKQGGSNERVWQAVIENAIAEWVRGPELQKRQAEYFLFEDEEDFPYVCRSAGLNPGSVRESLWAIRAQSVPYSNVNVA